MKYKNGYYSNELSLPKKLRHKNTKKLYRLTSIGDTAFADFDSISSITIPYGVTTIGKGAFKNCDSLISISIPKSVTSIGYGAFNHCDKLKTIYIPRGTKTSSQRWRD